MNELTNNLSLLKKINNYSKKIKKRKQLKLKTDSYPRSNSKGFI